MLPFWCCYGRGYRRHYLNRPLDQNAGSVELRWNTCDFFFQTVPMLLINVSTIVGLYLQGTEAGISTVTKATLAFNLLNFLLTVFSIFRACCGAAVETKQQLKQTKAQAKAARAPRRARGPSTSSPRARQQQLQHQQPQPQVELQPLPMSPSTSAAPLNRPLFPAGPVSGSGPAPLAVPVDVGADTDLSPVGGAVSPGDNDALVASPSAAVAGSSSHSSLSECVLARRQEKA